jgi:hypothetical protein
MSTPLPVCDPEAAVTPDSVDVIATGDEPLGTEILDPSAELLACRVAMSPLAPRDMVPLGDVRSVNFTLVLPVQFSVSGRVNVLFIAPGAD